MAQNCGCDINTTPASDKLVYTQEPPYVSQRSLQAFIDGRCSVCNEVVSTTEQPTYPDCCENQIVVRGEYEVLRVKDASSQSYVGLGGLVSEYTYISSGAIALTANVPYTLQLTSSGTLTTITNELNITPFSNSLMFSNPGFYCIEAGFETYSYVSPKMVNYHIYRSGAQIPLLQTHFTTKADPTEAANRRTGRVVYNGYNGSSIANRISFVIVSGMPFNTTIALNLRILRLSVSR